MVVLPCTALQTEAKPVQARTAQARTAQARTAQAQPIRERPTKQQKLDEALLGAIYDKDLIRVRAALAKGASANAREDTYPHQRVLHIAVTRG